MPLVISEAEVQRLVDEPELFEGAFRALEAAVFEARAGQPGENVEVRFPGSGDTEPRTRIWRLSSGPAGMTLRLMGGNPPLDAALLPGSHLFLYFDPRVQLQAVVSGELLNSLRVAVPGGLGVRYLQPERTRTLAILGSGLQAWGHLIAYQHVMPTLEEVRVFSPTPEHRERFARELGHHLGRPIAAVDSAQAAVEGADVIGACGSAREPMYERQWVKPGALVVAITGAGLAPMLKDARFVVPAFQGPPLSRFGWTEADGRRASAPRAPAAQLGDVIEGLTPAREHRDQIVVWDLAGSRTWDPPLLRWTLDAARSIGLGVSCDLVPDGFVPLLSSARWAG